MAFRNSVDRKLDSLLSRAEDRPETSRHRFQTRTLTDSEYEELDALMTRGGPSVFPRCETSPEERERIRDLLEKSYQAPSGSSIVLPWLLEDADLAVLSRLLEEMRVSRTGKLDPARLSPEERGQVGRLLSRAMVRNPPVGS